MQRRRHRGLGPRYALVAGIVLGGLSVLLYQQAYASNPYPGPIALPGIPPGPPLGCNNPNTSNYSWLPGFDVLSTVHFRVDGRPAGTALATSEGAVVFLLTFEPGTVAVNGNPPVADHPGDNTLTVFGTRTVKGRAETVGIVRHFTTPTTPGGRCAPTTTIPPSSSSTSSTSLRTTTSLRTVTTHHRFYPTTLAKVTETPLVISPNKVIMETSLIAGVLGAALSVGALGAMWSGNGRGLAPEAAAPPGDTAPPSSPPTPEPPPPSAPEPPPAAPVAPPAPEPEPAPAPTPTPTPDPGPVPPTSAFSRPNGGAK